MTREDIIRMAREAGFSEWAVQTPQDLERFAALVAAAERERVTFELVNEAQRAVQEAVWAEREACAEVCDEREQSNLYGVRECADAIRARGEE